MKHTAFIVTFLILFAITSFAQHPAPPSVDLVIRISDNQADMILNWNRLQCADSFHVYTGDSINFQIGPATYLGSTTDTTFTHVNALTSSFKRFYTVVLFSSNMVLIPAGIYTMGSAAVGGSAIPEHIVNVPAFFIDIYEVTNGEYKAFCDATSRTYPPDPSFYVPDYFTNAAFMNYPVVNVSWDDAREYAIWVGKRLPSEAEWELAAKGSTDNRQWPWGDTWIAENANVYDNPVDGYSYTSPVGNYPNGISPSGCYDMAGNVWEWCEDDWHYDYTNAPQDGSAWLDSPRESIRILRGGAWYHDYMDARCTVRGLLYPTDRYHMLGFRCVKSVENRKPLRPSLPSPADSSTNQSINVDLSWTCSDPDLDPVYYDVYFGTSSMPPLVSSGQTASTYDPGTLAYGTVYYWQIKAYDIPGNYKNGPVWSFTTGAPTGMVLVPAGPFDMGADYQAPWSLPIHTVNVSAFFIDMYEVTNGEYKAFCDATSRTYPADPGFTDMPDYFTSSSYVNYPVINVSWDDARAYAVWIGKRLPTEAEWERAAKGNTDNRQWPWGDTWAANHANVGPSWAAESYSYTSPVGTFPSGISPAGCHDMIGNVWEWCEDDMHSTYDGAPNNGSAWVDNPRGTQRIVRGGSFYELFNLARVADRGYNSPAAPSYVHGFRCAKSVENRPPSRPSLPLPADSSWNQSINVDLSWTCSDPDLDLLTYDVYFGTSSTPPLVSSGQIATTYDPGTLSNGTVYYWKIVAHDNHGAFKNGLLWVFDTETIPAGMVLVPAGSYTMGSAVVGSLPEHTVNVPAFYMDIYEVTNAQYKAFCDATSRAYPFSPQFVNYTDYFTNPAYANYPVVMVSWNDARAYAAWAGKRLPTEAEWERAAKGNTDNRLWPWGDTWIAANANIYENPADGYTWTSPVGNYPNGISPAGCYDMAGNVREWCEDDFHSDYTDAPTDGSAWIDNPRLAFRLCRGGSWLSSTYFSVGCAYRLNYAYPTEYSNWLGFRCAMTP